MRTPESCVVSRQKVEVGLGYFPDVHLQMLVGSVKFHKSGAMMSLNRMGMSTMRYSFRLILLVLASSYIGRTIIGTRLEQCQLKCRLVGFARTIS
jgi:hypothetical protein